MKKSYRIVRKTVYLPATTEATNENIKRAHYQIAHWHTAITGVPPNLLATEFGWETCTTATGEILVPCTVPPNTKDAPDEIREMIHCGCESSRCKGVACKCNRIGCTLFCNCEAGPNCLNTLTKKAGTD